MPVYDIIINVNKDFIYLFNVHLTILTIAKKKDWTKCRVGKRFALDAHHNIE